MRHNPWARRAPVAFVGDAAFTPPAPGLVPIFPGWNVWDIYQKTDLDIEPSMIGVGRDRRLQIFVENAVEDGAPGAAVADPFNPLPSHFKGDEVQIIPDAAGLHAIASKELVPGPSLLLDGPAELRTVRFHNRGTATVMPWAHDSNYLLDRVYLPETSNPVTNSPPPETAAQTGGEIVKGAESVGTTVIVVAGILAAAAVVVALAARK